MIMVTKDQFRIEVGPLALEPGDASGRIVSELDVVGDLRITVGEREWFVEPMFSVLELALEIRAWLTRGGDLEFETMEAEESPFLWVRSVAGGYMVGAAWQAFEIAGPLPMAQVQGAFDQFAS